jgi:hypothetical protein
MACFKRTAPAVLARTIVWQLTGDWGLGTGFRNVVGREVTVLLLAKHALERLADSLSG